MPREKDFIFNKIEAIFQNGQIVVGKIVDKEKNYVESDSEFFYLSVGKLSPNETVQITFSILKPLKLHMNKFYELQFPAITNQEPPFIFDQQDLKEWNIEIEIIEIYGNRKIKILSNPSHWLEISKFYSSSSKRDLRAFANVTVSTDQDYIVYFASEYNHLSGIDITPAIEPKNPNDHGFFLNIVPATMYYSDNYVQSALENSIHDDLLSLQKDVFALEQRLSKHGWSFLIDRSDSMKGPPFETLKKTLIELLQTLPLYINIHLYSFGNTSELYQIKGRNPNVKEAIEFVKTLEADMGERDLLKALKQAVREPQYLQASLIILTDGETLNEERFTNYIAKESTPLEFKICSLVIGNKISKKALQDVAKAGRCWAERVAENEDLGDRAVHLMQENVSKLNLYWKVEMECKNFQREVLFKKEIAQVVLPYDQAFHQWIQLEESPDFHRCELNLEYSNLDKSIYEKKSDSICHKRDSSRCAAVFGDGDRHHKIYNYDEIRPFEAEIYKYQHDDQEYLKQWIIKQSKRYQILSDFTSFVPVRQKNANQIDIDL